MLVDTMRAHPVAIIGGIHLPPFSASIRLAQTLSGVWWGEGCSPWKKCNFENQNAWRPAYNETRRESPNGNPLLFMPARE